MGEGEGMSHTRFLNIIIYGLEKAIWDMLGESSLAATSQIGKSMLEIMKKELALKVSGEKEQDVLDGIAKRLVEDFKIADDVSIIKKDNIVSLCIRNCIMLPVEKKLISKGVKPFICPFTNISRAAMEELLGKLTGIKDIDVSDDNTCKIVFEILSE